MNEGDTNGMIRRDLARQAWPPSDEPPTAEEWRRYCFVVEHEVAILTTLLRECQAALTGPADLRQRIEDQIGRP